MGLVRVGGDGIQLSQVSSLPDTNRKYGDTLRENESLFDTCKSCKC